MVTADGPGGPPPAALCTGCGTANPPVARFCMACGSGVAVAARTPTGLRFVTVTFCDISDSTRLAVRLSPEAWHRVLDGYFGAMRAAVEAHGGRVEKFIGDAVVGVFGADDPADDDALRAVQAAADALRRIAGEDGNGLSIRFGVASGQVVLAARDSSFAIGAVMNRAARLQSAAPAGGTLIDVRTWLLVRDQVRCDAVPPVAAKGFDTALQAWTPSPGGLDPAPAAVFVNQRALLGRVADEVAARLAEPGRAVIALDGEVGSGKTALLARLESSVRAQAARVLHIDCARDDQAHGLLRLLRLEADLDAVRAGPGRGGHQGGHQGGAAPSTAEVQWRIGRRIAELSAERPLLVLVDNVQWAPDELLHVVDGLPGGTGPVVFVLAGREIPRTAGRRTAGFSVPALSEEHSRRLLAALRARDEAGARDRTGDLELHWDTGSADLVARSGGNPLFLEQLAALAADGIDDLVAPSASAALGARIARLGHPARRVLGCIGAWGTAVDTRELTLTSGLAPADLGDALAELEQRGLSPARRGPDGRTRHECRSAPQVAYAHLPLADRAALHTAVARHLQRQAARTPGALDRAVVQAERALACIRELQPGSADETAAAALLAGCLVAAARRAVGRSDIHRALDHATRAAGLDPADPALRLETAAIESYALAAAGRVPEALALIEEVTAAVPADANPAAVFQLRANELALRPAGTGALRAARDLAGRAGDRNAEARLLLVEALTAVADGDYPRGEGLLLTAHGLVREAGGGLGTAEIHANLALCLAFGDSPVPVALDRCRELRADTADAPVLHAVVGCSTALLHAFAGEQRQAHALLDEAREVFEGLGHRAGLAGLFQFRGSVDEYAGGFGRAAESMRSAAETCTAAGAGAVAAAARCRASAWILDGAGPAPSLPADAAGWETRMLHHQLRAVRPSGDGPAAAGVHLHRALDTAVAVRGAGAVLLPLASCLRIARRIGDTAAAERAEAALAAAVAAKGARRPSVE